MNCYSSRNNEFCRRGSLSLDELPSQHDAPANGETLNHLLARRAGMNSGSNFGPVPQPTQATVVNTSEPIDCRVRDPVSFGILADSDRGRRSFRLLSRFFLASRLSDFRPCLFLKWPSLAGRTSAKVRF